MKIDITKSHREKVEINYSLKLDNADVDLVGFYKKDGQFLVLEGTLKGCANVVCDSTGEDFFDTIDEPINVKFVSGIYNGFDQKYDVIEIDSDIIDIDSFLTDEIESFRLGYHRKDSATKQ